MKTTIKNIVCGFVLGAIFFSGIGYAATTTLYDVMTGGIKIFIDGERLRPKDVNGYTVEPFIYEGTTYLPVRAISEALGFDVEWDGNSNSVYIETNSYYEEEVDSVSEAENRYEEKEDEDEIYEVKMDSKNTSKGTERRKGFILTSDKKKYVYDISMGVPQHDSYEEAYSSCTIFRDIFINEFGDEYEYLYDTFLNFMIELLYNDSIECKKEIQLTGFDDELDMQVIESAIKAVEEDYPFLDLFTQINVTGRPVNFSVTAKRSIINYKKFDGTQKDYEKYRDIVIGELNEYREIASYYNDDDDKFKEVSKRFMYDSVYDLDAPYHALEPFVNKRGVCSTANTAFVIVCQAVDIPAYWQYISSINHAVTLVKLNDRPLMVADATFRSWNPEYDHSHVIPEKVSDYKYADDIYEYIEEGRFDGFDCEAYFPGTDIPDALGGLS